MENQTMNGSELNNSVINYTDDGNGNVPGYNDDPRIQRISRKFITIAVISTVANFLIIFLVWTSKDNRQKSFLWHVTSLSVWLMFFGSVIIPLSLDWQTDWIWRHGELVCNVMVLSSFCHTCLCSLILVCASVDRMLAKVQLVAPVNQKLALILNCVLVFLPWVLVITITIPLLLTFKVEREFNDPVPRCYFIIDEKHYVPTLTIIFVLPILTLAVDLIVLVLFYILKDGNWSRISIEKETEEASLRFSTAALWIVCVIVFVSWLPIVAFITVMVFHYSDSCEISFKAHTVIQEIYETVGAIVPFVWLFLVEIRTSAVSLWTSIVDKFRKRNPRRMNTPMRWMANSE